MKKRLMILIAQLFAIVGIAQTFTVDGFNYNVISTNPNEVEVTGGTDGSNPFTIRSSVIDNGITYAVTTIGNSAYRNGASSVVLPNTITTIKFRAFRDNGGLTSITLPASVTNIEGEAFFGGGLIEVIALGTVPASIGNSSFGTRSNVDLIIPEGLEDTYISNGWTGFSTVNGELPIGTIFTVGDLRYRITLKSPNVVEVASQVNPILAPVVPASVIEPQSSDSYSVTGIGFRAFRNRGITSISFPSTITTIKTEAFQNNSLTTVTFPASVTTINANAFSTNPLLTEVISLATTQPTLETNSFTNRGNISLTVPSGSEAAYVNGGWTGFFSINGTPFIGSSFTADGFNYTINGVNPNTVQLTGEGTGILDLVLPSTTTKNSISFTVTAIGNRSFRNRGLTSLTLPNALEVIGTEAFENNNLTTVTLPASVTTISSESFNLNQLTEVISQAIAAPTLTANSFTNRGNISLTVPSGSEASYVNAGWTGFFTVNGAPLIGAEFSADGFNYRINGVNPNTVEIRGGGTGITDLLVPSSTSKNGFSFTITAIGSNAFRSSSLNSVVLPATIETIDQHAFQSNQLTTINLPASITTIGLDAFRANQLTSVNLPSGLITLGSGAFRDNQLTSIVIPDGIIELESQTFRNNDLQSVTLPANIQIIRNDVFRDNEIESITFPASLNILEGFAFRNNQLTNVTIPAGISVIAQNTFNQNQLTSITIPSNITSIEDSAFANNLLTSIIADSATPATITTSSFGTRSNVNLTIIPDQQSVIDDYVAAGWTGFRSINGEFQVGAQFTEGDFRYEVTTVNPNTVKVINRETTTQNIVIPATVTASGTTFTITSINDAAFQNTDITSVTIGSNITTIGNNAFQGSSLTDIDAQGTTPATIEANSFGDREGISLTIPASSLTAYENAGWTGFFSVNGSAPSVGARFTVNGIRYEILTLAPNTLAAVGQNGIVPNGDFVFPELINKDGTNYTITTIGNSAFRNKGVRTISLPSSVTTIEFRAFRDNGSLVSTNIPVNITSIGGEAFFDNGLTEVIAETLTPPTISNGVFNTRSDINLFIPQGTRQAYIDANWTGFKSVIEAGTLVLEPKVFLQGASLNPTTGEETLMRDDLRVANLIPTTSPYGDGATCNSSVFNVTGNDAIVDWVFVELRDATNNTIVIEGQAALLQRDGDVVATNGAGVLQFTSPLGNYFVVIKHRNHLGIMTGNVLSLTGTRNSVDFTNATSQITFGSNAQTTAGMPVDTVGMWAGNVNGDNIVQYSGTDPDAPAILSLVLNDVGNFLNFSTFIVNGYNVNDVDMDGRVQYEGIAPDAPFILQNVLAHPGNFLNFSTFQIQEQLPEN